MDQKPVEWSSISTFEEGEQSPGFLLWKVSTEWRRMIEEALQSLGLTHTQFVLLASIAHLTSRGTSASQVQLAQHAQLHIAMTSQVLKTLEKKGLIQRLRKKQDDRSKFPSLTQEGIALISKAVPLVEGIDTTFFTQLSAQEQATYLRLMQKLACPAGV